MAAGAGIFAGEDESFVVESKARTVEPVRVPILSYSLIFVAVGYLLEQAQQTQR